MLTAVGVAFTTTGVNGGDLILTGTTKSDPVAISMTSTTTTITVGSTVQTMHNANNTNITAITFIGNGGTDTLVVTGANADLTLNLTNISSIGCVTTATGGVYPNVTINSTSTAALNLGAIKSNNLSVTANSAITNTGTVGTPATLTVAGNTTIVAQSSGGGATKYNVTLNATGNAFGTVSGGTTTGTMVLTGANVTVVAATGNVVLGTSTITGNLAVTSPGTITDAGSSVPLTVTGTTTLTATTGIDMTSTDMLTGAISLNGGGAAIINGKATNLGASTINASGDLNVTSVGAVTSTGKLSVAGQTIITASSVLGAGTPLAINLPTKTNVFTGDLVLNGAAVTAVATGAVTLGNTGATNLSVTSTGAINDDNTSGTNAGSWDITGTTTLNAGAAAIDLTRTDNVFVGAVSLTGSTATFWNDNLASSGTTLGNITLTGALNIGNSTTSTVGQVQTSAAAGEKINVGTTTTIYTDGSAINIGSSISSFTGSMTLDAGTNGGNVTVNSKSAVVLAGVSAVNLNVTGTGVSDSGSISTTGTTIITAGKGNVTLTDAGTGDDLQGVVSASGAVVSIKDTDALQLGNVTATGALTAVSTGGDITEGTTYKIAVTGLTTLTPPSADDVDLQSMTNTFGGGVTVSADGSTTIDAASVGGVVAANGATVIIDSTGSVALGAITTTGNLQVSTTGSVTDTGALTITGTTTVAATNATPSKLGSVTLNNAANAFTGDLILSGKNITVVSAGDVSLGATAAGLPAGGGSAAVVGNLAVTATGHNVSDDGSAITVTGTTNINVGTNATINATNYDISLADTSSAFTGAMSFTGNTVGVANSIATVLGASTIGGALTLDSSAGAVSNTGTLNVTGILTIDTSATSGGTTTYQNINLATKTNVFATDVDLTGNNVTVDATGAVTLGATIAKGTLNMATTGAIGDDTTSGGLVVVTGASTLNAGTAAITFSNADTFTGAVGIVASGATLTNSGATNLGVITLTNHGSPADLAVTSGAAVTTSGKLTIGGTTAITAPTTNNVALGITGSVFTGLVTLVGQNVTMIATGAVNLGNVQSNNLSVTSTGNISDNFANDLTSGEMTTDELAVGGTLTLNAGKGNISLANTDSLFSGLVALNGANVSITNTADVDFATSTITGNLSVTSSGNITNNVTGGGALIVDGSLTADANGGSGAIDFENAGDLFKGTQDLNGDPITVE